MKISRCFILMAMSFCGFLIGAAESGGAAARDPRLHEMAGWLESGSLDVLYQQYSYSDWTRSTLGSMSRQERHHLAKLLRKNLSAQIRYGHIEQYRVTWRSRKLPDSDFVISFFMSAAGPALEKPAIAFSSQVNEIPDLLARALERGEKPMVLSLHDPQSRWTDILTSMRPPEVKTRVAFYRSLEVLTKGEDEWMFKGPTIDRQGTRITDQIHIRLQRDGRWLVE